MLAAICGAGQKGEATKWLVLLFVADLLLSLLGVAAVSSYLAGGKAMGKGSCFEDNVRPDHRHYEALGQWVDAPPGFTLNWFVCERYQKGSDCAFKGSEWQLFAGSCYKAVCQPQTTQPAAELTCNRDNATLVTITSESENQFVQNLCGWESCWIGLSRGKASDDWVWEDFSSVGQPGRWSRYVNWVHDAPYHSGRSPRWAYMNSARELNMPPPNVPYPKWRFSCPSQPRKQPQGDGKWYDIVHDWDVDAFICERSSAQTCEDGWSMHGASCYKRFCSRHNFAEAGEECASHEAHLVKISNGAENDFVAELCGLMTCYIGLSELDNSEEWAWHDGTSVGRNFEWTGYTNWDRGQPNNGAMFRDGRDEDAAVMNLPLNWRRVIVLNESWSWMQKASRVWNFVQLGAPVAFVLLALGASSRHSACLAQALVIGVIVALLTAVAVSALLLASLPKTSPNAPGSATLVAILAILALAKAALYGHAKKSAQELQWTTTAEWVASSRELTESLESGGNIAMRDLSAEFAQAAEPAAEPAQDAE